MSDKKDNPNFSGEQEWVGSFYGVPKNPHAPSTDASRDRKKISTIDRVNTNDGHLSNKKRDISALVYTLRLLIILVLLTGGFLLVRVGIGLYQERLFIEQQQEIPPAVMSEVPLARSMKFDSEKSIDFFTSQCVKWENENTNLRAAHELIKRDYLEKALERCNYVLSLNPSNKEALEMAADLYTRLDKLVEAINAYIRLLNLDVTQKAVQEKLIEALYFHNDYEAVIQLSNWYYEKAMFNERVHYLLFRSHKELDQIEEALKISDRILKASPDYVEVANDRIELLIILKRFNEAIEEFDRLQTKRYRDPLFYRDYALCHAQLGQVKDAVEVLGKAVNIFGRSQVISWLASSDYDKIRSDSYFNTFSIRVGGEEVTSQIKLLTENRRNDYQVDKSFLNNENFENTETISPQLNILDRD